MSTGYETRLCAPDAGLGTAVKYIPRPVTIGFTNGIALLIASTQIRDFLGLTTPAVPGEFFARMHMLIDYASTMRWQTMTVAAASLAVILLWPRVTRRVPGTIVALLLATLAVIIFRLPVETIGSKFGGIPLGFPHFERPHFHGEHILPLLPSAFSVALLAAVESLLSEVVADGMSGDRHNPNMELVAQGKRISLRRFLAEFQLPAQLPAPQPTSAPVRERRFQA